MQQQQPHPNHTPTGFRPIVPAPPPMLMISPSQSPLTKATPQQQTHFPPFETPPVSPFSNPRHSEQNSQPFKLPPPLQTLPSISIQQPYQPHPQLQQSSSTRYEPILPKQGPSTSVFSIPLAPQTTGLNTSPNSRPVMSHHTSVIHPLVPHHHRYSNVTDKSLTTADQRELQRKVSHSAIERRRRERINDKIMQLKDLIPCCADQDHLHKLNILQNAIDYIQYLQELVVDYKDKEKKIPRRSVGSGNKWNENAKERKEEFIRKSSKASSPATNISTNSSPLVTASQSNPDSPNHEALSASFTHSCNMLDIRVPHPPPFSLDGPSHNSTPIEGCSNMSRECECINHEEAHVLLSLSSSKKSEADKNKKRDLMDIDERESGASGGEEVNNGREEGREEKISNEKQQQQQQRGEEKVFEDDSNDDEREGDEEEEMGESPRQRMNIQQLLVQDTHND
ncbi:5384_t:CDS:2 [Paraglomus brasilianum]|uniref:5384_t:CDS:1 n=1 Tax=Paraglomus brasilianum TaxID=144538 RepID=A0A9N8W7Y4_9GLOM|nr:5384_t:CDS:2 [Paraglomus brasilianum]